MIVTRHASAAIDCLNALLRGEQSAVETYRLALAALAANPIPELDVNCNCHARRVRELGDLIGELGGTAETASGSWGGISAAAAEGATVHRRHALLAVLVAGEEHCLAGYRDALGRVDDLSRRLIERDLIPSQHLVYERIAGLSRADPPSSSDLLGVS